MTPAYYAIESRLTASLSERMLDLADVREGMRVLDLASGRGEPALRAARRVGANGHVLGVDLDERALNDAREQARRDGLSNIELRAGNAETIDEVGFDRVTARWGLMYMPHPERALEASRRALKTGDLMVAAFWAEPERVEWWSVPRRVTSRFAELPPLDLNGPSPFRFARDEQIEAAFTRSGFDVEHVEDSAVAIIEAADSAGIATWARTVLGRMVNVVPDSARAAWDSALAQECEAFRVGASIRLGGVTRIVLARARENGGAA